MLVWRDTTCGTIGGGALEWDAMAQARRMLMEGDVGAPQSRTIPLGPALRQCCGGSVTLLWEWADSLDDRPTTPLWIWGAGHVGRALATVLAPLPGHRITLADIAADRMPAELPGGVTPVIAADLGALAAFAPPRADHLIVTHSHEIDLALCHALLGAAQAGRDFASLGVIGSATKWARFRRRLAALGHTPEAVARIACPIGDPRLGKHPAEIAVGVAAALLAARGRTAGQKDASA